MHAFVSLAFVMHQFLYSILLSQKITFPIFIHALQQLTPLSTPTFLVFIFAYLAEKIFLKLFLELSPSAIYTCINTNFDF